MRKMTRKDLISFYNAHRHCKIGYCCEQQPDVPKDLRRVGYNYSKIYGWNWNLFVSDETDTIYISCYRNVPKCIVEK